MPMLQPTCDFMPHICFVILNIGFHFLSPVKQLPLLQLLSFVQLILHILPYSTKNNIPQHHQSVNCLRIRDTSTQFAPNRCIEKHPYQSGTGA